MTDEEVDFILHVVDILESGSARSDRDKIEDIERVATQLIPQLYTNEDYIKEEA